MTFDYENQQDWPQVVGQSQSPINLILAESQPERWTGLNTALRGTAAKATDKTLNVTGGGITEVGGRTAIFDQLHFHQPAEHVINGKRAVMEAHFVHHFSDGQTVIIAVPLAIGEVNPVMAAVLVMPETPIEFPISLRGLLPTATDWYHYMGSRTTPPVREGASWYVAARPQTISADQLAAYVERFPLMTNRDIQPLNDRPVLLLHL